MNKPDLEKLKPFVVENKFPTDILIETNTICNLNCIMCPQSDLTRKKGEMSFELWKKIIDEVAFKSPKTKIWPALMGEPLLRGKELFKMIKYARDKELEVHLNTNLLIINDDIIDGIFDSKVDEIIISLDGATKETYEKIRNGSNFNKVVENIIILLNEKDKRNVQYPKITIQFIVMDENVHEEQKFIDFWKDKKVFLKVKPRTAWGDYEAWQGIVNISQEDRFLPCTWLLRQMTIFWDGKVPICDMDFNAKTDYGDINKSTIEEIWLGKLKQIRDRHIKLDFDIHPCKTCENWQAGISRTIECGKKDD